MSQYLLTASGLNPPDVELLASSLENNSALKLLGSHAEALLKLIPP